jgi:hypothetical protein
MKGKKKILIAYEIQIKSVKDTSIVEEPLTSF